jgi:hypothetical protein
MRLDYQSNEYSIAGSRHGVDGMVGTTVSKPKTKQGLNPVRGDC